MNNTHVVQTSSYLSACTTLHFALFSMCTMPRGTASKALGPFYTMRSRTPIYRRLKSLEEVVGKELGAP